MKTLSIISKIICIPLILAGLILCFIGYYDFFRELHSEGPNMLICALYGIPILTCGVVFSFFAFMHKRAIKISTELLIEKGDDKSIPDTSDAINIATNPHKCDVCGQIIDNESFFCKYCGNKIDKKD